MRAISLSIGLSFPHSPLIELFDFLVELGVLLQDLIPIGIYLLELFWEFRKTFKELFDNNDAKHEALAVSAECLDHKFEGNTLEHIVQESILDNCTK